ncbi:microfibril-associated glycoprotein 4-like [Chanos chanos]|uniref:Microfibril-associated glycoprotein 4-like n=1 Tax=Chanos chanos TaxID=29144 RepID=A0A6J2VRY3_CHACN|nr:microfibril-associated glycoprotein 4-like [Chanos chanos]
MFTNFIVAVVSIYTSALVCLRCSSQKRDLGIGRDLDDNMLAIDGARGVWEVSQLKETLSNGTPVLLGWHWHEVIHQAVPDDLTNNSDYVGHGGVADLGQVVVSTPHSQVLDLVPVGHLIVPSDQAYHHDAFCKLDYGVRTMYRNTVMGEEGVQKKAQHTALWHTGVKGESGGGEFLPLLILIVSSLAQSAPNCSISMIQDCDEISRITKWKSGVYTIYPGGSPVEVYCDMDSNGGRWTVIQRRMDGTVNFFRPWDQYKKGFGNAEGEYWLGLENINQLTQSKEYELRVDLEDFSGVKVYALYSSFSVASETEGYRLLIGGFTDGGAGDSLTYHNGSKFSTFDVDQDASDADCARRFLGAFWYRDCHYFNPNGVYVWGQHNDHYAIGITWKAWKGFNYSVKAVSMKIRPVS